MFPRVAAVFRHAGAGTTTAGLRAGVPAVAVVMAARSNAGERRGGLFVECDDTLSESRGRTARWSGLTGCTDCAEPLPGLIGAVKDRLRGTAPGTADVDETDTGAVLLRPLSGWPVAPLEPRPAYPVIRPVRAADGRITLLGFVPGADSGALRELVNQVAFALRELTTHCSGVTEVGLSGSDYPLAGLDVTELREFLGEFELSARGCDTPSKTSTG
ncbi:hypothetical protein [Amycolatopsis sp. A1MSW2902]|uniref:hypothetical protein n=1 Tax=Amycolatopsis sp. A1MSW2902 TaxID=687413 RepID=UPI00307E7A64